MRLELILNAYYLHVFEISDNQKTSVFIASFLEIAYDPPMPVHRHPGFWPTAEYQQQLR